MVSQPARGQDVGTGGQEAGAGAAVATEESKANTELPVTAETKTNSAPVDSTPAGPTVVEDAMSAAEGTRTAAKWIASSLGAIPGLTVIASIVRAPGDAGFYASELTIGVFLAAAGALLGILAFANVLAPAAIEEKDLDGIDVRRLPGHPFSSYRQLAKSIADLWQLKADKDTEVVSARALAGAAEARIGDATGDDDETKQLKADVAERKAKLAELSASATWLGEQLSHREAIRTNLYRLAGADKVRSRYELAAGLSLFAVAAVAGGLILLGLAPKPKSEAVAPSLVTLKLNKAGKKALACESKNIYALKIGGDEETPKVISLPSAKCPIPKQLDFSQKKPTPLGSVGSP